MPIDESCDTPRTSNRLLKFL
uniref:Uncharacterized protein n=1 Tax=Arundo donax TaxID=35708 RepID=A0A0A9EGK4_ARUDO